MATLGRPAASGRCRRGSGFALLAFDQLGETVGEIPLVAVTVAVTMGVVAHGLSAGPLARWYDLRHRTGPEPITPA